MPRLFDRRGFEKGLRSRRQEKSPRASLLGRVRREREPESARHANRREFMASKSVLLAVLALLIGMLLYGLIRFFQMVYARGLDIRRIFFVPAGMIIVLFVLLRVARRLVREIKQAS